MTIPSQKKKVPIVRTSDGTPKATMSAPLSRPTPSPAARPAIRPGPPWPAAMNTHAPTAITAANERSISPAMTTSVSASAMIPVSGTVDISAL